MNRFTIPLSVAAIVLLISCNQYSCDDRTLEDSAYQAILSELNEGTKATIEWESCEPVGDGVRLIKGYLKTDGLLGAKVSRRSVARVWCNGREPTVVTMLDVDGLIDKIYLDAGKDTLLIGQERDMKELIRRSTQSIDSALNASQRLLDSIKALHPE